MTEYEISYAGRVSTGSLDSGPVEFEVVSEFAPDHLALRDPEMEQRVRDALQMRGMESIGDEDEKVEVKNEDTYESGIKMYKFSSPGPTHDLRSMLMRFVDGKNQEEADVYMPTLKLLEELPVDLCFDVEIQLLDTGASMEGRAVTILRNRNFGESLYPKDLPRFLVGREGIFPMRVLLTPSRSTALTNLNVTEYYAGVSIQSEIMRAKIVRYRVSEASPTVLRLRVMFEELVGWGGSRTSRQARRSALEKGITRDVFSQIKGLSSLNPGVRAEAAERCATAESALTFPLLVELLGDLTVLEPTGPAKRGDFSGDIRFEPGSPAEAAMRALLKIGAPAVPALTEAMRHVNPEVRWRAEQVLGEIEERRSGG